MKRLYFTVLLILVTRFASGQSIIAFAPWEWGIQSDVNSDLHSNSVLFSGKRVVPVSTLLPQVTRDSYLVAFGLEAGPRFVDSSYDRIRFRLTAADIALQRAYTSGGVTILDYDQSGLRQKQATWIRISFGPGFHFHQPNNAFWFRATGSGSLSSIEDGRLLFGEKTSTSNTGFVYTLAATTGMSISNSTMLKATIEREVMSKASLEKDTFRMEMQYSPVPRFTLLASYDLLEFRNVGDSMETTSWSLTLCYSPSITMY